MRPEPLRRLRRAALLPLLALLPGCATLSEAECHTVDWHERGLRDGHAGRPVTRVFDYGKDCGKHGVTVDGAAWRAGHQIGLIQYCTPERGYEEGLAGRTYRQVCPLGDEARFLQAYRFGEARAWVSAEFERVARLQDRHERVLRDRDSSDEARRTSREQLRLLDAYFLDLRAYRDRFDGLDIEAPPPAGRPDRPRDLKD